MNKSTLKTVALTVAAILVLNQFEPTRKVIDKVTGGGNRFFR